MPDAEPKRDMRAMFNRISGVYDFLNHLLSFNADRAWRRHLAKCALRAGDTLALDVCCGTGDSALAVATEAGEGSLVVGIDFAEKMLRRMRRKAARRSLSPRLAICLGDALHMPFKDGTFDAITCGFGIRNLPDRAAALAEMLRVTKRGGRIAIMEFVRPATGVMRGPAMFYVRRVLPFIGRIFSGDQFNAYAYLPESIMKFPAAEEFRRDLLAAGCSEAACEFKGHQLVAFFTGTK